METIAKTNRSSVTIIKAVINEYGNNRQNESYSERFSRKNILYVIFIIRLITA